MTLRTGGTLPTLIETSLSRPSGRWLLEAPEGVNVPMWDLVVLAVQIRLEEERLGA